MLRSICSSSLVVFLLGLGALGLSGCDISSPIEGVDLVLDVEDASVNVGSVTTDVRPDQPSVKNEEVNPDTNVKEVRDLRTIRLKTEFFDFSSGASGTQSKAGQGTSASGTLEISVFFAGYPLPQSPFTLTITDDVVTEIAPTTLSFQGNTYDLEADNLRQLLEDLGDEAPDLENWENATLDEVETALKEALRSDSAPISVAVEVVEGNLSGSLTVDKFNIDAQVAR